MDLIFNEETSNTQNVSITILNDICLEEDGEDFSVVVTSGMDCVEIVGGSVSIAIHDDDSEFFCIIIFFQSQVALTSRGKDKIV